MRQVFAAIGLLASLGGSMAVAQDADIGAELYNEYCATCHGASAKGDGPMTDLLTTEVPDLTQLAANTEDGEYPMLNVIHIIDGRTGVRGHGGAMPTFGNIFSIETVEEMGIYGSVLETRGRLLSLALYLESIQE